RLPQSVVVTDFSQRCDAVGERHSGHGTVRGTVRCDCPGKGGISDARVHVLDYQGRERAVTTTDGDGRFVVLGLMAGEYQLHAEKDGFEDSGGSYFVFTNRPGQPVEVGARLVPELLRRVQGQVPLYPQGPRERGLEGLAQLSLSKGVVARVSGDAALLDAAEENLQTWQYEHSGTMPFAVT